MVRTERTSQPIRSDREPPNIFPEGRIFYAQRPSDDATVAHNRAKKSSFAVDTMNFSVTFPPDSTLTERRYGGYVAPDAVCHVTRKPDAVEVEFVFTDCPDQLSGHFSFSPDVARWLAGALLAAADHHTNKFPISVSIENDATVRKEMSVQ